MVCGYFKAVTTDRLHREVLLTTADLFIIIQIEISEAQTNACEMTDNAQWHCDATENSCPLLSTGIL